MAKQDEGYCKDCGYVGGYAGDECPECDSGVKLAALNDGLDDYEDKKSVKPQPDHDGDEDEDELKDLDDDDDLTDEDLEDDFDEGEDDDRHHEISLEEAADEENEKEDRPGKSVGDDELDEQE